MFGAGWLSIGVVLTVVLAVGNPWLTPLVRPLWYRPILRTQSLLLTRGDATAVQVELHAVAHHFSLSAGATRLLQADVTYAADEEQPRVAYIERANRGYASLYQPLAKTDGWGNSPNRWAVKLREDIPYYLIVNLSTGAADLDLSRLSFARLHLTSRSDQLKVDLTHKRPGGLIFFLQYTGSGVAHIQLPTDMPVQIHVMNGLTQINGQPQAKGDSWGNLAYSRMLSAKSLVNVIISDESGAVVIDV